MLIAIDSHYPEMKLTKKNRQKPFHDNQNAMGF